MDNRINPNISFQAKLITQLKGRNNIMSSVVKEFEYITMEIPGEFYVGRCCDKGIKHLARMDFKNASYATKELFKLLSNEAIEPKAIANKLANQMKAMRAGASYSKKADKIRESMGKVEKLEKTINEKLDIARNQKKGGIINILIDTINSCKMKIRKLRGELSAVQEEFLNKIDKYKNRGLDVTGYIDYMKNAFIRDEL